MGLISGSMSAMTTPLEVAVAATIARLEALEEADEAQKVRWEAYAQMNADGLSHRAISLAMIEALEQRGLSEDQIRAAGVSHDSITLALSKMRDYTPKG